MIQLLFPFFVLLGIVISSGVFIITTVKDKEDKLRYLLHFAGARPLAYYLGMFMADIVLFCVPISLLILMSYFLSIKAFYESAGVIFLSLMVFGVPYIALIYLSGFLFSKSETAFKYSFLFLFAVTAGTYALALMWPSFATDVVPYINPLMSMFYCV